MQNQVSRLYLPIILALLIARPASCPAYGFTTDNGSADYDRQMSSSSEFPQSFELGDIRGLCWLPQASHCSAAVLCMHGASMWSGSFKQFSERMAEMGIAIYAIDVPGFGPYAHTDGQWKYADLAKALPAIKLVLENLHARYPGKPVFLLGESMGGCLAVRLGSCYPQQMNGIICSAPAWRIYKRKHMLIKAMIAVLLRSHSLFEQTISGLIKQATNDPQLQAHWQTSPEYRFEFSASETLRGISFLRKTSLYAPQVTRVPVLMLQGLDDRLVNPKGAVLLFKRMPTASKKLILISNSEHLIFQEVKPDHDVVNLVLDWIQHHSSEQTDKEESHAGILVGATMSKKVKKLFHLAGIEKPVMFSPCP